MKERDYTAGLAPILERIQTNQEWWDRKGLTGTRPDAGMMQMDLCALVSLIRRLEGELDAERERCADIALAIDSTRNPR